MRSRDVRMYSASIWLSSALATSLLSGCAAPPVIYKDRLVRIPVPESVPLNAELTMDCPPEETLPPSGPMTVSDIVLRLGAVEDALLVCREELSQIRAIQPVLPGQK